MELFQTILTATEEIAADLFSYVGILVIAFAAISALVSLIRRRPDTGLVFLKGLTCGLDFKIAAELVALARVRMAGSFRLAGVLILIRLVFTLVTRVEANNTVYEAANSLSYRPETPAEQMDPEGEVQSSGQDRS